jgi:hypothetical protein
MEQKDDLVYNLIFSNQIDFSILVTDYIKDIYKYDDFIIEMKEILRKSKVPIIKETIEVTFDYVRWNVKVKK